MKKILITNDDGITADGIIRLAKAASSFGRVYVIAPNAQCSAMSHSITLRDPIDVSRVDFPVEGVEAYATTGSPADCVRFGIPNIIKDKPDLVLSGINFGFNCGTDIQYSATVGAALEGACCGVRSIALSEGFSGRHEVTDACICDILEKLSKQDPGPGRIWNVNFPDCALSDYKGILKERRVADNSFYIDTYVEERLEDGTIRLMVDGQYQEQADPGTDFKAVVDGYISVGVVNNLM